MARTGICILVTLGLGIALVHAQEPGRSDPVSPPSVSASAAAPARPASGAVPVAPAAGAGHIRAVLPLKSLPAAEVANAIVSLLRAESDPPLRRFMPGQPGEVFQPRQGPPARQVVIQAEPLSNSLLVSGPPDAVDEVRQLAGQLDRPIPMVLLEVLIGEAPADPATGPGKLRPAKKPEKMEVVSRMRLTTIENLPARVQVGRNEPTITGVSTTTFGRMNQISHSQLGTVVMVTPRVGPAGVVTMEIDVNHTQFGPAEEGAPLSVSKEGEITRALNHETITAKTTVRVPSGQSVVLGGQSQRTKPGRDMWIVLTPHVLEAGR